MLLELLDVLVRELDVADERLAFVHAMAIAAAGDEKIVLLRHLQIMFHGGGRMFGVVALDAIHAGLDERRNERVVMHESRMRDDRETASIVNEFNRVVRRDFEFRNPGGPSFFQKALEGFIKSF